MMATKKCQMGTWNQTRQIRNMPHREKFLTIWAAWFLKMPFRASTARSLLTVKPAQANPTQWSVMVPIRESYRLRVKFFFKKSKKARM